MSLLVAVVAAAQEGMRQSIPARPPIGGFWWTVVAPALLLLVSFVGTLLLYRAFAGKETGGGR